MSRFLWVSIFILAFTFTSNGQVRNKCSANSDKLYDRKKTIKQLAKTLNKSIPERKDVYRTGYDVTEDGKSPAGFFIYDLTDPSNKDITSTGCIEFEKDHIYHFAPFDYAFSLSHIAILENGKLKIFKSINCKDRGDRLEDVIAYVNQKLANDRNKDEILERVKNYRKYGKYFKMDNYSTLVCQAVSESKE
ncbi:MAG: hypothetical protein IGR93_09560 [Hydrococcus sp. C42_A2020_068]|nr:hypothetical protein [Hydrococcus sp. C42_A2020_068]